MNFAQFLFVEPGADAAAHGPTLLHGAPSYGHVGLARYLVGGERSLKFLCKGMATATIAVGHTAWTLKVRQISKIELCIITDYRL